MMLDAKCFRIPVSTYVSCLDIHPCKDLTAGYFGQSLNNAGYLMRSIITLSAPLASG